jgi:hypothetical protein
VGTRSLRSAARRGLRSRSGWLESHDQATPRPYPKHSSATAEEGRDLDPVIFGERPDWVAFSGLDPTEEAVDDALHPIAIGEVRVEELVDDDPLLVHEEEAGEGDAVERDVLGPDQRVEHAVLANHVGVDIGEHREFDSRCLGVRRERLRVVVADREELDARIAELAKTLLQLN